MRMAFIRQENKAYHTFIGLLFITYLFLLVQVVLLKEMRYSNYIGAGLGMRPFNLIPFHEILGMLTDPRLPFITVFRNIAGNIVIFIPFGMFVPWLYRKSAKFTVFSGFLLSAAFETIQFCFGIGILDVDDLILNVLGTGMGAYLFYVFETAVRHPMQGAFRLE